MTNRADLLNIKDKPAFVGTSGYKYDDWKGTFYNKEIPNYRMIEEYSKVFNFLEITFSFYSMPYKQTIGEIISRANEQLTFSIRLHKSFLKGNYTSKDVAEFIEGVSPISEKGRLKCLFGDFNYKFTACKQNVDQLVNLRNNFSGIPFFVELPNRTWYKERYIEDLKNADIGIIILDMPQLTGLAPYYPVSTNYNTYMRFYGKSRLWLTPEEKFLDYNYSKAEFVQPLVDLSRLSLLSNEMFISFCNVQDGYAAQNAVEFMKMLQKLNNNEAKNE